MIELPSKYNPHETEDKWLKFWKTRNIFHATVNSSKPPFTIVIPPPNVTGVLHMGHALNNTLQDILMRYKRMNGYEALWMPGTDHAGIATQNVVEKQLAKEGKRRGDLGREGFIKRLWAWKREYGDTIIRQLEKLGSSCDWSRTRFTMDEDYSESVEEAFVHLYRKGLIYRGQYIINWCPRCQTALSDEEAEHQEKNGKLYHLKYPFKDNSKEFVVVATTRPETMLGDTAVAVNPKDERYTHLVGKILILPLMNREIKIIADDFVAMDFGTGALKVTPAHDPNDFAMGQRHQLPMINVMRPDARINELGGKYKDLDRFEARKRVIADLEAQGLVVKIEDHQQAIGHCYRCDTVVEPYLSKQWFVKMKPLATRALAAVKNGEIKIYPEHWEKVYINWIENIRDWCISRQIWWGHRIPVWYCVGDESCRLKCKEPIVSKIPPTRCPHCGSKNLKQDDDVLDTWFSSWLWPFATLGWPQLQITRHKTQVTGEKQKFNDLEYFYPTGTLFTASEILFFWVARMIMAGYEFMGDKPFTQVLIHGTVRDAKGRKMSKSLGNAIDPLEIIREYGADALRFSLIINSGQDILISKEKFEIGRNFANKIWNASRLVLMHCQATAESGDYGILEIAQLDLPSRWIVARFYETLDKVGNAIENFRYSEAETLIQAFFWGSFCDWYLELIKGKLGDIDVQRTVFFVLKNSLKMMHPFLPFVTEEIYSKMNAGDVCLSLAAWPKKEEALIDILAMEHMQMVIDVVGTIRNMRSQWNIKPQEKVHCLIFPHTSDYGNKLQQSSCDIQHLANTEDLKGRIYISTAPIKNAIFGLTEFCRIYIPHDGLIDIETEKKKKILEIGQKEKVIKSLEERLNNPTFVSKAPEDVILKEKERLAILNKDVAELEKVLTNLS